jgi:hypothetical protein
MAKKNKYGNGNGDVAIVRGTADTYLQALYYHTVELDNLRAAYELAIKEVDKKYALKLEALEALKKSCDLAIMQTMKYEKKILFDGTDVVNLPHGSLIRNVGDHVTIPKTALESCKENKFNDVIKIVESLDRDAIEKWPDAKLVLIGAERKKKEEFKYTVKGEK